jgi:D-serine deaminase-like pyridoxal phosphate-dependent protein
MAGGGIDHLLISTELVGAPKLARLAALARHVDVMVVVDAAEPASRLATLARDAHVELGVLVDVNVGQNRTGVEPGGAAVELARHVAGLRHLRFEGLQGYEGNLQHIVTGAERERRCREAMDKLVATRRAIEQHGLPVRVVSTGGTGTCAVAATYDEITEVQPGSYIFMDADYGRVEGLPFELALTVLTTVISRPRRGVAIVDAGLKAISTDAGIPQPKALPGVTYRPHGDEHGRLEAERDEALPGIGDILELVPSHCDTTVNLHDSYVVVEQGHVQATWAVAARGRVA